MKRTLWRLALLPLVAYGVLLVIAFMFQSALIYPRYAVGAPDARVLQSLQTTEEITLAASDGTPIVAWFTRGDTRDAASPGPCVVFAHGNGELIDHNARLISMYRLLGVSTLLVEYRGYGRASGSPSQKNIVGDFAVAREWLRNRPEVKQDAVIYHGRSLGGGVLIALAETHPPAAIIVESTFTSMRAMFRRHFVPGFICRHPFENERVLPALGVPTLIMHGTRDTLIPAVHGKRLAELTPGAVYKTFDCSHNDLPPNFMEYQQVIAEFLTSFTASDPPGHPR